MRWTRFHSSNFFAVNLWPKPRKPKFSKISEVQQNLLWRHRMHRIFPLLQLPTRTKICCKVQVYIKLLVFFITVEMQNAVFIFPLLFNFFQYILHLKTSFQPDSSRQSLLTWVRLTSLGFSHKFESQLTTTITTATTITTTANRLFSTTSCFKMS